MQLPYKPKNVMHRNGGKILEVTEIRIQLEKPTEGNSRDCWYFMGRVQWNDGSGQADKLHPIDMYSLCADDQAGQAEITELGAVMMAYLKEHGVWNDKGPHRGWYAHRTEKRRAA